MIEIEHLTKRYGSFTAVDNLVLSVEAGEIFSFLGVNGAGKTTTLRMLAGVLQPTAGKIRICGWDLAEHPSEAKRVTGYIPDRPHLYGGLTGREYLWFMADLYSVPEAEARTRIDSLLERYALRRWQEERIESYSHGMKQRIATCGALVSSPQVLIVDEPMVGLDPHGAKTLKESFREFSENGMTVFLSTHSLHVAEELSDRIAIINAGKIIAIGTLDELRQQTGGIARLEEIFLQLTVSEEYGHTEL